MIKIALIGITAIILAMIFKNAKNEYSFLISISACIIIVFLGFSKIQVIIEAINKLQGYIQMNRAYMGIIIKIIGLTYITEFSSTLCKDSGFSAISEQIELVGKLSILAISMPILLALLETINNFLTM